MKQSAAQGSEDPILQWVTFKLDNETYGINVMQVQEVLRYTKSHRYRVRLPTCWASSICAATW